MGLVTVLWGLLGLLLEVMRNFWPLISKWNPLKGFGVGESNLLACLDWMWLSMCLLVAFGFWGVILARTLQGTNCYLIGNGDTKVLVDTGEHSTSQEFLSNLVSLLHATKTQRITHVLLTHGHYDHQGEVVELLRALKKEGMPTTPVIMKRMMPGGGIILRRGLNASTSKTGKSL